MQCTEFSEVECGKGCGCVINLRALYLMPFSCSCHLLVVYRFK